MPYENRLKNSALCCIYLKVLLDIYSFLIVAKFVENHFSAGSTFQDVFLQCEILVTTFN